MRKIVLQMEPFTCPSCIQKIEHTLKKHPGIQSANVLFHSGKVRAEFFEDQISAEEIERLIVRLGYHVLSRKVA